MIAKSQIKSKGSKTPSPFIDNLAFGTFNKAFSPNRTASDWLTRVDEEVDRYIAHPWCGFIFTTSAFAAMFDGLSFVQSKEWPNLVPKKPILLIAGDKDPVGSFGKGVTQVEQWLLATDHSVKKVLYPEARHEILNETNRYEVYEDIASFVKNAINI